MDYHVDLYDSIKNNSPQEALYYTGEMAKKGHIDLLQHTWFRLVSCMANFSHFSYKKWQSVCSDIVMVIENDSFHISNAFVITIKLCLLFKDCNLYFTLPKLPIGQLRTKVIGFFGGDFKLSEKGLGAFQHLLPRNATEREFCIKTLTGLISLWNSKKSLEFRNAVEFVDRKRFEIEIPSDIHMRWGAVHYTFNILLWECLCILEPSLSMAKKLYQYNYSRKHHNAVSIPFLLASHAFIQENYNHDWTEKEQDVIDRVRTMSAELSNQIVIEEPVVVVEAAAPALFENFFPTTREKIDEKAAVYEAPPTHTKMITLHKRKKMYKDKVKANTIKELPYE